MFTKERGEAEAGCSDIIQHRVGSPHQNKLQRKELQTLAARSPLVGTTMERIEAIERGHQQFLLQTVDYTSIIFIHQNFLSFRGKYFSKF